MTRHIQELAASSQFSHPTQPLALHDSSAPLCFYYYYFNESDYVAFSFAKYIVGLILLLQIDS